MYKLREFGKEYDNHRWVNYIHDPASGLEGVIAIHRGSLSLPAFGATRIVSYNNTTEAVRDALKLSRLMSYKAALAGLRYGGAKGVIMRPKSGRVSRTGLLKAYAEKVHTLGGRFITGADVGIKETDVKFMKRHSQYFVGVSSDPVLYTALGLVAGMRTCLKALYASESFAGKSIAIQGVGKIGTALLRLLYREADKIFIADLSGQNLAKVKKRFPKVTVVKPTEIFNQKATIYAPCALGSALTLKIISKIKAEIIAGGANNQLENKELGALLHSLGILYAPDYVINAGGLIAVVDEYEHKNFNASRTEKRVMQISSRLEEILETSSRLGKATNVVADSLAEHIFNNHA